MSSDNKKIQIIMEDLSYLARSFENAFRDSGVQAEVVDVSDASIHITEEKMYAYIIFTGKQLLRNSVNLKVFVDMAIKAHIPLFAIGNAEELEKLWKNEPKKKEMTSYKQHIKILDNTKNIIIQLDIFNNNKKKTILCIDDSGVLLRKMKALLEDKYEVVLVNSAAMAIKFLTLRRPDLILLDYEMPIVNGAQVMQMIREDNDFKDIPIVFLTGKKDLHTVQNIVSLKPEGYILKDTKPKELHETIDRYLLD